MSTTPTLRDALQAARDYGSAAWDDWLKEKVDAALAALPQGAGEAVEPVAWMHDTPGRVEVIHAEVKKLLRECNDSISHLHRPIDKSTRYTIPLYDAQQLQQAVARYRDEVLSLISQIDDGEQPAYRHCQEAIRAKGTQ